MSASLTAVAKETLAIVASGAYQLPSGERVELADAIARAERGTILYRPGDDDALDAPAPIEGTTSFEVTGETTAEAARRLVEREGATHVAALNFASAKNPGGGFLSGAKAQEEDLARCSALYRCQLAQPAYYEANRAQASMMYTDHLIYSPDVPFLRDDRLELARPFLLSVLTSPAPNAGAAEGRPEEGEVHATLVRRAAQVLRVAAHHRHRVIVLGAWGCGVFRNDPREVADVFAVLLASPRFERAFERVVFAIFDRSKGRENHLAFERRFGPPGSRGEIATVRTTKPAGNGAA
jgi:uncharacterized protein (TIGR02452 family)